MVAGVGEPRHCLEVPIPEREDYPTRDQYDLAIREWGTRNKRSGIASRSRVTILERDLNIWKELGLALWAILAYMLPKRVVMMALFEQVMPRLVRPGNELTCADETALIALTKAPSKNIKNAQKEFIGRNKDYQVKKPKLRRRTNLPKGGESLHLALRNYSPHLAQERAESTALGATQFVQQVEHAASVRPGKIAAFGTRTVVYSTVFGHILKAHDAKGVRPHLTPFNGDVVPEE